MKIKNLITSALTLGLGFTLLCQNISFAQTLYISTSGATIRRSTDGGATWSNWHTNTGSTYRGLTADIATNTLFAWDTNGNYIRAINMATGSFITNVTLSSNVSGSGGKPIMFDSETNRVYVNFGTTPSYRYFSWDGANFGAETNTSSSNNWNANDFIRGGNYIWATGSPGANLRATPWNSGTLNAHTTVSFTISGTNTTTNIADIAVTPLGRFLVLFDNGTLSYTADGLTSNTSSKELAGNITPFSGTGTELAYFNGKIYAANTTQLYVYDFDDTTATFTFSANYSLGVTLSSTSHLVVIPEPKIISMAILGLTALLFLRHNRNIQRDKTKGSPIA
ncbi:MAG: hypothetical protein NZL93_03340 [Chthoniobacterales bacterium]|nr:hypothetical protein [Chthoniobacterales bacterium]